ncbi:MAG: PKD-like family lipoprotein, partial [Odoribacter sp.]
MKNLYVIYFVLFSFLISACYDDLGNYDYDGNVNVVNIELNKAYAIKKMDTDFVIRPTIHQSSVNGKTNLRYMWRISTEGDQALSTARKGDTLCFSDTAVIHIDTKVEDFKYTYWLRFYVEDTITKVRTMFPIVVSIVKPYKGTWMVLHRNEGMTKLGAIEYIGDQIIVTPDAYFKERGVHLQGMPVKLGRSINTSDGSSMLYCFTDNPGESGILLQADGFKLYGNMERCIYPADYRAYYDPAKVTMMAGNGNGGLAISNGRVFQGAMYVPRMCAMKPTSVTQGEYFITHGTCGGATFLVYDRIGRRFFSCVTRKNWWNSEWGWDEYDSEGKKNMELIAKNPANATGINLDDIGSDKEMVFMGTGFWYGETMSTSWARTCIYALVKSKETNKSWVYEFHSYPLYAGSKKDDPAPVTGVFSFNTPVGMTAETPCATSSDYNRILFYAVDNRVYRLDFGQLGGKAQLIWQHPNVGAKAKVMRMAWEDIPVNGIEYGDYEHNPNRSLGIAFELSDGTSEVVILDLNNAGKLDADGKYPAVQQHSGFGKITDIAFI